MAAASVRKTLILTHRWMGIVGNIVFVLWFVSGVIFAYKAMPTFSVTERLAQVPPLDLRTAQVEPIEAARRLGIKPTRLRLSMSYDGRPVYRFQGASAAYADTGEAVAGRDADQAVALIRSFEPSHAATVRYESLVTEPDLWTFGARAQMPLHKIAIGDAAATNYYVSQATGEPVMKADRMERIWGFWGPVVHQWYFTGLRQRTALWDGMILWASALGSLMCLLGIALGVWQFSTSSRYRLKGESSHTPYTSWMKWHHYAGLIFGLVSLTWIFSGGLAFDSYSIGSNTNPTASERDAGSGGPLRLQAVTLDALRQGLDLLAPIVNPKEADVLQFRGEPYLLAADGPPEWPLIGTTSREPLPQVKRRMAWLAHPERGVFSEFDHAAMMDIAKDAKPGVPITEATWLDDYDNYYRNRQQGLPLPVLRVQYADANQTWLYIDAQRGGVNWHEEKASRLRRWLYNGLHKFDLPYIWDRRPVWDLAIVLFSLGGLALSVTSLVPAYRRLRRYAGKLTT